jgi:Spy/CpxP family protein refolding chaperone
MNSALKWKLAFAFLLVFLAGLVTGGFLSAWHARHLFLGPPHSGALAQRMRDHLRHELSLTPEQEAKIRPIVDSTTAQLEAIRIETAERVRSTMDESVRAISPQLTAEQQTKLQTLQREHRRRFMHHGGPGGPLPPPLP